MGMFDPFERGEKAELLRDHGTFILVSAKLRKGIQTEYGKRDVADLRVATTHAGSLRLFSAFWAGIVGQVGRMEKGDLPATVRIIEQDTGQASPTYMLELVDQAWQGELPTDSAERDKLLAIGAQMQTRPIDPVPVEEPAAPAAAETAAA